MRGCVAALLFSLLTAPAYPQCNLSPVASAQFRSTIFELSAENNRLWAATSYGLTLYDTTVDPPRILDTIALPGSTRVVRAGNGVAYAASGSAIQFVRWTGREMQLAGTVDAGATVNDLLLTTNYLYAATTNGIAQYDLLNPAAPQKTFATFATSGANVTSLALAGSTLYATDGDASLEIFSLGIPSAPQRLGAFTSALARPVAVNAGDGRVYLTDGNQTEILIGTNLSSAGTAAFGSISFAPLSPNAIFVAGSDRRLRAFDVSTAGAPVEIFRAELAPTSGTVNRINAVAMIAGRLYAGAGDIGLLTYDTHQFAAPFPLRSYTTLATNSVAASATRAYFGRAAGLAEYIQSSTGTLTEARSWDKSRTSVVHDFDNDFLLTSSGATATLWALTPATPTVVGTATFPKNVLHAVLTGTLAYVVLEDRTLWTADLANITATPTQRVINAAPQFIARSGGNVVIADLRSDGTTTVAMLTPGATGIAASANVPGLATAGVALFVNTAAVWTFRGLTLIDFPSGATTLLPQSNSVAPTGLALYDFKLVEMTDGAVIVWDTAAKRAIAQYTLPSTPASLAIAGNGSFLDLATPAGVTAIQLAPSARMPSLIAAPNANFYAKKIVATANRLVLFDGRNADVFTTSLEYRGGIRGGTIDVAANDTGIYTLTNNLAVGSYSQDGGLLGSAIIAEGPDAQPLSITAINGAAWASIVRGCPLNCEKKTIVFDTRAGTPAQTTTMTGAVRDVVVSGTRAYVLTELPDEIRILDVSDPAHPRQLAARASEGSRLPQSIAYTSGTVFVLGEKLFEYDDNLTKLGEPLGTYVDDATLGVTYADQRVRVDGGCLAMTGRQFSPQLFTTARAPQTSVPTPSAARALAAQPGRLYVLTDHSLEVWSSKPLPPAARRHAAR